MQSHHIHDLELSIAIPRKNQLLMKFWDDVKTFISSSHENLLSEGKYSTLLHEMVRENISNRLIERLNPNELNEYMDYIINGREPDEYDNSIDNVVKVGMYTYARVDQERVLANKLLSHFYCGSFQVSSFNQIGQMIHGNIKCSVFFCEKCQNHVSKQMISETGMNQGNFCTVINKTETNWDTLYRSLRRNGIQYISMPMGQDIYMVITNTPNEKIFQKHDFYGFRIERDEMTIGDKVEPTDKIGTFTNKTTYPLKDLHLLREHGTAKRQNGVLTGTLIEEIDIKDLQPLSATEVEKTAPESEDTGFSGIVPYVMNNAPREVMDFMASGIVKSMAKFIPGTKGMYDFVCEVTDAFAFLMGKHHDQYYQEIGYKMMRFTQDDVDKFNELYGFDAIHDDEQTAFLAQIGANVQT